MPRIARSCVKNEFNHVIVQGINKEFIFGDNYLKKTYIEIMKKNLDNKKIRLLSYCVMGNHTHMLTYSKDIKYVSEFMHKTNTAFAKRYNSMKDRVGYVFRNRFYLQQILSKKHLHNCIVYIHKNPLKAGMVERMQDYGFSSYNEYKNNMDLITKEGIELVFGDADNYIETFDEIHKKNNINDILDIEEKKSVDEVVKTYMVAQNKSFEEIKLDKECFGRLLFNIQQECNLSLREIAKIYNIGKDKVRSLINGIE